MYNGLPCSNDTDPARPSQIKGNELLQKAVTLWSTREAIKTYTEGIDCKCSDDDTNSKLYANRALANFKLRNFGKVVEDCKEAIKVKPSFIKPYYRAALAYKEVERLKDAIDILDQGLKMESGNKELLALKKVIQETIDKKIKAEEEKKLKAMKQKKSLEDQCWDKGVRLGTQSLLIPESYKMEISFDKDNYLHTSIAIVYPEFSQMDFIQDAVEDDTLGDHLVEIFKEPLPWDQGRNYSITSIEVYVELLSVKPLKPYKSKHPERSFKRIDLKSSILDVLKTEDYICLLYTSPSPRDGLLSRMPSSA
eukprot:TRINITY_DN7892_c0_g1_i9.p1 TRINITY_DN7892_c0_g1~~TRINITY_DN7892_c0_g1_i9.p1  ORF type:complete len:308 (-),score=50.01 TRINITY_DN7892_c0_g1_i9:16-939(-)